MEEQDSYRPSTEFDGKLKGKNNSYTKSIRTDRPSSNPLPLKLLLRAE